MVLNAVVGIRDECLAQVQAGKAQISLADLCGEETISCRVLTQCSQMAARLQGYLHRLVGAGFHPLWCFMWAIDELVQAEWRTSAVLAWQSLHGTALCRGYTTLDHGTA